MRHVPGMAIMLLVLCLTGGAGADDMMSDDFEGLPEDRWRFIADGVMGGVSSGAMSFHDEGGEAFARLQGVVSTENNGGFIQMRRALEAGALPGARGVRLVVRGNGEQYFVHLRSRESVRPWYYYQAGFSATAQWREVRLPFDAFAPSRRFSGVVTGTTVLTSIAVVAYGRAHEAQVDIREIGFY